MSAPEIRPSFEVYVPVALAQALDAIEDHIERCDGRCHGWVKEPYAELRVPVAQRRWFSPRLAVYGEEMVDGATLSCRIQPEPDVWTFYVATWSALGLGFMGVNVYGYSQWMVNETPWAAIIGNPIALLLAAGVYASAFVGQRLGRTQMTSLREQLATALAALRPSMKHPPTSSSATLSPGHRAGDG